MSDFRSFTAMHGAALLGVAAAIAVFVWAGRAWRGTHRERMLAAVVASAILLLRAGVFVWNLTPGQASLARSLPLQICDWAAICSALALLVDRRWLWSIAYFWGLALSVQGLVQPDLAAGPSSLAFWLFWMHHALIVGVAIYVVAVRGFRPAPPDLRLAIGAGVAYVAVVFPVDLLLEVNYGYLGQGLPSQPTILDWLGPWPWRVAAMMALGAGVMVLLYLPWHRSGERRSA
ncbi:MAG TPA: TIGR02206 family membrane protein [Gemmatimonadaceae bacterium]|nr:TIGR02206 family membrane protein [Gemmatimonadaceae bacterium]